MQVEGMDKRYVGKEDMQNIRVLQRNLVYAVGIPSEFAREDLLRSKSLFGGFGEIVKVVISKRKDMKTERTPQGSAYSAYITYSKSEYAVNAIREMNDFRMGDKTVRCTFGTTKYCSFFLRGIKCTNEGCLYLHEKGRKEDSFSRDQMSILKMQIDNLISQPEESSSKEEEELESIEGLTMLFMFKPEVEERQSHYESCQFNPFCRQTSGDILDH
ncbi:CCR4-NOT transcription complex subunit 4 [Nematocida sp. AWRm80]|nr:CCR4-NOT transcription complex subunit 4 [Nematocida sp. AWRm80]